MKAIKCDICDDIINENFISNHDTDMYEYDITGHDGESYTVEISFDDDNIDICHKCISKEFAKIE